MTPRGLLFTVVTAAVAAPWACSSPGGTNRAADVDGGSTVTTVADGAVPDDAPAAPDDALSVTPPLNDADTPASDAGPGGPWIAFTSDRSGDFDVFLIHPDGTGLQALVTNPATDQAPAWSPDGASVAFQSNRGGPYQLYVVDVASGATTPIATAGVVSAYDPSYSPDGATIVFGSGAQIFSVPSAGGTPTALTTGTANRDSSPVFAPDGSVVYFASDRAAGGAFEIWSVKPDGTGLTQITTGSKLLGGPAVSHDGATLAFAQSGTPTNLGAEAQVAFFALATKTSTVFSAMGDTEPAFAQSGARIAMSTTRYEGDDGNVDLVLEDATGANPFRLTHDIGVSGEAAFQPAQ